MIFPRFPLEWSNVGQCVLLMSGEKNEPRKSITVVMEISRFKALKLYPAGYFSPNFPHFTWTAVKFIRIKFLVRNAARSKFRDA